VDRTSWSVFEGAGEEKLNHPDFFPFALATEDALGDLVWDFCVDPIPLIGGGGGEPVEFKIGEVCVIGG
jgi:hypothetical protein